MVEVLDDDVGELVAKVNELGIADNTLIMFTSDNGPHQEGGHDPAYFNSNGSQRGFKRDLYEGGIHVPMIATWPGHIPAGTQTDHLSAFWDVLPTVAELAGQSVPESIDGISFVPTLLDKPGQKEHDYLYWEFHEKKGRVAMRQGNWKAVRYNVAVDPDSPLELFDLSSDPGETKNVADKHPDVVAKMNAQIKNARTASNVPDYNFPLVRTRAQNGNAHKK
jgi:arylsulfatase A-like enzyme